MFCRNCGNEIESNSKFCDVCGKPVEMYAASRGNFQMANTQGKKVL